MKIKEKKQTCKTRQIFSFVETKNMASSRYKEGFEETFTFSVKSKGCKFQPESGINFRFMIDPTKNDRKSARFGILSQLQVKCH